MATILNNAAYMGLPINIKRGNPIPLDTTAVWYSKSDLETYAASGATSYVGQVLTLVENDKCEAYMISNVAGTLVKLAQTTASGDLASDVATLQTQVNALIAKVGAAADGDTAATGIYKLIEDVKKIADQGVADAATAKNAADAAQADVDALEAVVGEDDTKGLRKKVADNTAAIATLNGTGAGSVDKKVADAIDEFATKVTENGTIDTFKELVDWVAAHPEIVEGLTGDIAKLNAIVDGIGGEGEKATVVEYVADAIAALNIDDYAKAKDLTDAIARIATLEGKPAVGITADQIKAWDAKQDAGDYVEQSVYDAKIEALETADSNNSTAIAAVKRTADAAIPKNEAAAAGTGTKITTDANGVVVGIANLAKSDIPTIDQDQVDGLATALAGKQNNLTFNTAYDASTNKAATMSDVGAAKDAVVGTAEDASSVDTVKGAKKYAEEKASDALTSAKNYADGILSGDSGLVKRVGDLESKVDVEKVSTAIATAKTEAATDASTKDAAVKSAILGKTEDGADYVGTVKGAYEAAAAANTLASGKTTMAEVEAKNYATKAEAEGYANAKDTAIAAAKKAGDDAAEALETYKTSNDKRVKAIEDKEAAWDGKQDAITDGSAAIASVANGVVTIKAGVAQDNGAIKQGTGADVVLAKVASTGAAADISVADAAGNLTATTVEGALAELATAAGAKAVSCEKTSPEGVAARYIFKQGGVEIPNAVIDIPKDMVVSSGEVITNPEGQTAGTYLVLTLANATNDKVYINVGDLIEYVVSGSSDLDSVQIAISADHKVTASIKDGSIEIGKLASAVQDKINLAHSHTNKAVLDGISAEKVEGWDDAATKAHEHSNKTVLDLITKAKVDAWDAAEQNAKDYADGLKTDIDTAYKAADATNLQAAKDYADEKIAAIPALSVATADTLGGVKSASGENQVAVAATGVMSVNSLNVNKLVQTAGDTLILNGGSAAV